LLEGSPKSTSHLILLTSTRHEWIRLLLCIELVLHLHLLHLNLLLLLLLAHRILQGGMLLHGNGLKQSILLLLLGIEWVRRETTIDLLLSLTGHWFILADWCLIWRLNVERVESFLLRVRLLLLGSVDAASRE